MGPFKELSALPEVNRLSGHPYLLMACMSAAIVAYSRGFVNSHSTGHATTIYKFNHLDIAKEEWVATLHKRIIEKRHQAVAHSDWAEHTTELDTTFRESGTARLSSVPQILNEIDAEKFLELTDKLYLEVALKCHLLDKKTLLDIQKSSN
jgi:hypothetical protein